ncbi:MAG TPA: HEPN domain-containing protein [Solirubrobacterales bacterium]
MTDQSAPDMPTPEFSASLLDQVFRLWIEPAIAENGAELVRSDVVKALVVMAPLDAPTVYLNDDAGLIAHARAARSIDAGQEVTLDDISSIEGLVPSDIDPNAAWVALAKIGEEIVVAFDFRRNRQTATSLLQRATEFVAAAESSLEREYLGPAIENGFAAAELTVKAEMFLIDDRPTQIHHERVTWWSEWEKLGNAPPGAAEVLQRLYVERGASRYGDGPISMSAEDVHIALDSVAAMIDLAKKRQATAAWVNR